MNLFDTWEAVIVLIYIYCIGILIYLKANLGRLFTVENLVYNFSIVVNHLARFFLL